MMLDAGGEKVTLTKEDLLIEMTQKEGFVSMEDGGVTVVLDTNLTQELIDEGIVNEVISKPQNMRKDAGFEVTDHITVFVSGNENIAALMRKNAQSICSDTLAEGIEYSACDSAYTKEWDINCENVTLGVKKI